ncbi:MAG: hypothetical protein WDN08_04800 [Rhizomicrobium sp.]
MKSARTEAPAEDDVPLLPTVRPPPGGSVHDAATAKMGSFELAAALQKLRDAADRVDAASGARLRSAPSDVPQAPLPADEPPVTAPPVPPAISPARGFALLAAALLLLAIGTAMTIAASHH